MYIEIENGEVFIHAEPWDKFLWLAYRSNGTVKRYMPQMFWARNKYKTAEWWLRRHADQQGYNVVENNQLP